MQLVEFFFSIILSISKHIFSTEIDFSSISGSSFAVLKTLMISSDKVKSNLLANRKVLNILEGSSVKVVRVSLGVHAILFWRS